MSLSSAVTAAARAFDDAVVQGRREHEGVLRIQPSERERFETEWKFVVPALQRFLERASGHSALQNFAVSRDYNEMSARFKDGSSRGYSYVILSRRHPTNPRPDAGRAWLTPIGGEPIEFADAALAAKELIRRILVASV